MSYDNHFKDRNHLKGVVNYHINNVLISPGLNKDVVELQSMLYTFFSSSPMKRQNKAKVIILAKSNKSLLE